MNPKIANQMTQKLSDALTLVPSRLDDRTCWDSLLINRRKPHTYRAFMLPEFGPLEGYRICLHRFDPCEESDAFLHPHPWPSAMLVLEGHYRMKIGASASLERDSKPIIVLDEILSAGSSYCMDEPRAWHSVQPLTTCWSLMVNGKPWDAHAAAPTTKGKNLDKLNCEQLKEHLSKFKELLGNLLA